MMHKLLILLMMLLLLAGCAVNGSMSGTPLETVEQDEPKSSIEDLAAEFRSLRPIKGHFEGGTWNDDVDKWMGRKHQLMIQLGSHLGSGEYSQSQVIQLLAAPDLIAHEGDELYNLVNSLPDFEKPATGPYEFLIYYWRGSHDFLYFTSQGETIINSGWWYAGE
ncbi:MAG: hypothetical protein ONB14_12690 [candidate division KSB1 bacterium]|nr:hypothetical protein [candidate division KSB1 bacterium]